ncbi:hypothetical protein PR202_gb01249 [Eleusine coracana subsp. coracana]|uniref:Uncharacterized protein n=1 Tax=Eleusine coracana subsp. coracana TaxID=191504 RepID=A0AAV5DW37_ELECO|nr:hypothetical protein PR202_gb01249 [Eleusine coracana subsp. coracana]
MADAKEVAAGSGNDAQMRTRQAATTFAELGVCPELVAGCDAMGWTKPTKIQAEAIPNALQGRDLIALAHTGSGKTAAFALPIMQALLEQRKSFFACVLSPTRELAIQISEQFQALESSIGVVCTVLVGGADRMQQVISLTKRPHIVVGTPGRLLDHLRDTKGFSLKTIKYLVLDEADKLLDMNFETTLNDILEVIPKERKTFLFSATMTKKDQRLGALNRFKAKECKILTCRDVASRGLDIQGVDIVINYDFPLNSKDYVHRVGRTARAGESGCAVSLSLKESGAFKKRKRTEDY